MRSLRFVFLVTAVLSQAAGARANDSSAEYATGGLRLKSDPDIAMQSEDLAISMERVRVAYTFVNHASVEKTILVAFPMPDIVGTESDDNFVLPTEDAENLFDFAVTADGRPVTLRLDQHAIFGGVDHTARLRELAIPLMPISTRTGAALDRLPKAAQTELQALGLVRIETYDEGKGMQRHLTANWTLRSAYIWEQRFPSRSPIALVQTYRPSVGGTAQTMIGAKGWRDSPEIGASFRKYCIDAGLVRGMERAREAKHTEMPPYSERRMSYVLRTGANWAGPIGAFHLMVDKGAPRNVVSFCAEGVAKTGPTTFEVRKTNYTPKSDLDILLLVPLE